MPYERLFFGSGYHSCVRRRPPFVCGRHDSDRWGGIITKENVEIRQPDPVGWSGKPVGKSHFMLNDCFMRIVIFILFCVFFVNSAFAQNKDELAITNILTAQVVEWNKGNVDGYMKGYWESDSLLFIGSSGPRYGYQATLKRYKEAYPDAAHMGVLTSTVTSMQRLSAEYYFIVGKWELKRSVGDVSGSYTLLLRKIKGKWVVVCDHSS